jgi:amino acid permease
MLTGEEAKFVDYWAENRTKLSSFKSKLLRGLPTASIFGLPILLLIVCVYLFLPEWYIKVSKTSPATFLVVIIAVVIIILFYAFAKMHFKWEMNEQLYLEFKAKQKKADAAK